MEVDFNTGDPDRKRKRSQEDGEKATEEDSEDRRRRRKHRRRVLLHFIRFIVLSALVIYLAGLVWSVVSSPTFPEWLWFLYPFVKR
jgi:hypothetical protein